MSSRTLINEVKKNNRDPEKLFGHDPLQKLLVKKSAQNLSFSLMKGYPKSTQKFAYRLLQEASLIYIETVKGINLANIWSRNYIFWGPIPGRILRVQGILKRHAWPLLFKNRRSSWLCQALFFQIEKKKTCLFCPMQYTRHDSAPVAWCICRKQDIIPQFYCSMPYLIANPWP